MKHLPVSIQKQLSNNSPDEKIFKEAAIYHENTLNKVSYINKLVSHTPSARNQRKQNKTKKFKNRQPLYMKIIQVTQNCRRNTRTLKGPTLFQK